LRSHFKPEFLNRLDEIIIFHSLKADELREIVGLQIERLAKRLEEQKITLNINNDALDLIATAGYDPVYGARPIKRAIQKELETQIAKLILAGRYCSGSEVNISKENNKLTFN